MWAIKVLAIIAVVYVAIVALMYVAQTRLIFPTGLVASADQPLPADSASLDIEAPNGTRLSGISIPAVRDHGGERLLILGFGGNAWNADSVALYLHGLFPDADVIAFHYRGYSPSTGEPSAAALVADGLLVHDHVVKARGPVRVVTVGFSIGAGVAAYLASQRPLAGLILVTPFDSLEALARDHYPWLPVGLLLRHRMPTIDFVREATAPTALIAAERDTIVPPERTQALRPAIVNLVLDRTIPGAGHNDIYHHPEFHAAMAEALKRIVDPAESEAGRSGKAIRR